MPKLDFTMGAIEIGVLVSTLLYGMTVVQSYIYFASNAPDRLWLKSFVALVRWVHIVERVMLPSHLYVQWLRDGTYRQYI
jgi:hypothetical protein